MQITNSVAVITGAASGLGEEAARSLAASGASVVLADMNEDKLQLITKELVAGGFNAKFKVTNVTDESSVTALMDFAIKEFGAINIVLACAGIIRDSYMITPDRETGKVKKFMSTDHFKQVIDVNLTGVFITLREAAITNGGSSMQGGINSYFFLNKSGRIRSTQLCFYQSCYCPLA